MFCAIPAPWSIWDEEARDKMLLFLPVVGLEIGLIWSVLAWAAKLCALPAMVTALLLCAYPYLVTGYIHLDGFMDVTDAVRSCRDPERRREILKDSHVGSFAVIGLCLLMLSQFAFFTATDGKPWILIWIPVVSRCCSALAVTVLKPMTTSQYAAQKKTGIHAVILVFELLVSVAAGVILCGKYATALLGCLVGYGLALRRGYQSLGGMNGDISGYALTIGEVCAVAVYALI